MVRERFQEIVDFATTQSPYRSATKGWISDDVYLELGASEGKYLKQGNELANVSFYWQPINQIISILFGVVLLATTFVFFSVSISHGRINFTKPGLAQPQKSEPVQVKVASETLEPPSSIKSPELEVVQKIVQPEVPKSIPSVASIKEDSVKPVKILKAKPLQPKRPSNGLKPKMKPSRTSLEWI